MFYKRYISQKSDKPKKTKPAPLIIGTEKPPIAVGGFVALRLPLKKEVRKWVIDVSITYITKKNQTFFI